MLKSTNTIEAFGSHYVADKYDHIFTDDSDDKSRRNVVTPATGKISKKETNSLLADLGVGTWSFDVQCLLLYLSPAACKLLDLPVEKSLNFRELLVLFIKWQQASLLPIFKQRLKSSDSFTEDLFIGPESGCEGGWFKISGKMYDNGRQILMGTVTDITAAKTEEIRQKDMVALLNHELRTPLSIVKLYLQTSSRQAREKKYYSKLIGLYCLATQFSVQQNRVCMSFRYYSKAAILAIIGSNYVRSGTFSKQLKNIMRFSP
jgi:signal transduction histidine kinase